MTETIITAKNLSKCYRIGVKEEGYKTLREAIIEGFKAPITNLRRLGRLTRFESRSSSESREMKSNGFATDTIWALEDVSFEVKAGEVLGVIGRNGAGKSTLLKILTRITEPTTGEVKMYGRVASLLEVGTGFHPELTGRENIYLNAAILGMRRTEIDRKFDEIVAFAEIEKFIDTPVKRYSTGMYVRLAFAVAAQLEPEILLVDEVLAVGDITFQRKCLGKMSEVAKGGRTILFVSHNMHAISSLCERVIWLESGRIKSVGIASEQVAKYNSESFVRPSDKIVNGSQDQQPVSIESVGLLDMHGNRREVFDIFEDFHVELKIVQKALKNYVRFVARIRSAVDDTVSLATTDWDYGNPLSGLDACSYLVQCEIPKNLLNSGTYYLSVGVDEPGGVEHVRLDNVIKFSIVNTSPLGEGIFGQRDGTISPYRQWRAAQRQPVSF